MESISMMGSPKNLNETFLPNVANGIKDANKVTIGIIGSGDFAKSLTIRLIRCGYHVVVGSRNPKHAADFFPHVVDVTHHEDAVAKTNIIFVAIHREHYTSLWDLKHLLAGKILIDVSNNTRVDQYPDSNAEYLASLFPDSLIVKGFNVISAWSLQLGPKDASRQVYICSNNVQARHQVIELARQLSFIPIDLGALSSSKEIENLPLRLFTLWKGPVVIAISLATFFFIYSFLRDVIHPYMRNQQSDFYKIPIEIVNKTLPIVAITLLSLVYLSGLIAAAYQLYYGTKYRRFPPWLDNWLQCRKQLGLLSFFFAAVHVVYSLCLPMRRSERYLFLNMAYQQVHANVENSWNEEEVWRIEMYISFGIMSLGLLSLLAVTSIPSVNSALNWREFSFIQSTLGYIALLISTFHVLIYGWKRAFEEEYYRFYTPPNFVLALVLPSIVILGCTNPILRLSSEERFSSPLIILVALLWTRSSRSMSFLCWDPRAGCSAPGGVSLTRAEQRGRIPSPSLLPTLLLAQPRTRLGLWAVSAHGWVMSSLIHQQPQVLLGRAAPHPFIPQSVLILGVALTQMQHLALGQVYCTCTVHSSVCGFTPFHDWNMQTRFQLWCDCTSCKQRVLY
ncbi:metalloreductase STEAP2 isoform X1 [Aphelocoma coerulescens]|uniref:metalloreductase STEAP2 isoform X1 n=2 Tax=Aphelocoma coerulescens TaxID=39617 RepID=UPI003604DAFA